MRAFQKMPDKKLKVVSGGDDFENVKSLAKDFDNIEIFGWVNDSRLVEFIGNSIASIYIPINEDFGMTPLESMSAGKPCIGVNQGGLKETIINKKTGIFIPAEYAIQDITEAVRWMTPARALSMRRDCESQAEKFSQRVFIDKIKLIVQNQKPRLRVKLII